MALLVTSVFGVAGCGSDDDVQAGSRVKNAAPEAPEAFDASDAPSKADCDLLYRLDLSNLLDRLDLVDLDLRDQCDAASDGGADSVTTTTQPPASEDLEDPEKPGERVGNLEDLGKEETVEDLGEGP